MIYFLRTIALYLILFIGLSVAIQQGFQYYYADDNDVAVGDPTSLTFAMPPQFQSQTRNTETGLLLAGMTAQNRRDWGAAWQNFSLLNNQFDSNPQFALRSMTLALGNGDYKNVSMIADQIDKNYFASDSGEVIGDAFDFARLFLILKDIKNKNYDDAKTRNDGLAQSPLSKFATPVIQIWIDAVNNPDSITSNSEGLSPVQIYYKAIAAQYAGKSDVANALADKINPLAVTPKMIVNIAILYNKIGSKDQAIQLLGDVNDRFEDNIMLVQAVDEIKLGNKPLSADAYYPKSIEAALAMAFKDFGYAMYGERAVDSGLLFARLATYLDSNVESAYFLIGQILELQGQHEGALDAYSNTKWNDENYNASVARRAEILINNGRLSEAKTILTSNIQKAKQAGAENAYFYYILGNILKENKEYQKAVDAYDAAEILGKHDGELPRELMPLYYSRAIAFDLMDSWDNALADLNKAMEIFPNNPLILNYIGYAYADRGIELEKAKEMIMQAVMAAPNDAYITDSMGWILYRLGEYNQAVQYLERAASLDPYHMVINDHLGDAYWKVGRKIEAHYMWQRALDYFEDGDAEQVRMIDETKRKLKEGL